MIRISAELARAYCVLRQRPDLWFTSKELARWACTAPSTSRSITRKLAEQGLLEVRRLSPAFLFRANFASGDVGLLQALDEAREVYGLPSDLNPAADQVCPGGSRSSDRCVFSRKEERGERSWFGKSLPE